MQFVTDSQRLTHQRVGPWLAEIFPQEITASEELPSFSIALGSAVTEVEILPWKEKESLILARAKVVREVGFDPTLLQYLLRQNNTLRFGSFSIEADHTVVLQHALLGETCDREELEACIRTVASAADRYDDEIRERWGGLRAVDKKDRWSS